MKPQIGRVERRESKREGEQESLRRAALGGMSRKSDVMVIVTNMTIGKTIELEKLHNPQQ
jgi:hypothetical protein